MGCFLDVLRCILFCGDDDDAFDRLNSRSSSNTTGHCRNYHRVEDFPIRSPLRPTNSSLSESYSSTTTLLYPCKPSRASPPLNASVSPSPSLLTRFSTASGSLPSKQPNDSAPKVSSGYSSGAFRSSSSPPKSKTLPFSPQSSSRPSESKTLLFSSQFQQADASRRSPGTTTSKQKHTPDARDGNPELNGKTSAKVPDSTHISVMHQASTRHSKPSLNASASPLTSSISSKLPVVADPLSSKCSSVLSASSLHGPLKKRTLVERYEIPEDIEVLIKNDKLPAMMPLTPHSYADYFRILLYAEEYELEKWSEYLLEGVTLELREKKDSKIHNLREISNTKNRRNDQHSFVAFEIEAVRERRPYLLSRDFVFVQPSDQISAERFKGVIVCVVKSRTVLVEFGRDFHKQHSSSKKYNVSFSFNRVCLKRSHIAISAATNPLLCMILFPNPKGITDYASSDGNMVSPTTQSSIKHYHVIRRILNRKGLVPYLIEGPLAYEFEELTDTGKLIQEAVIQIHINVVGSKILICAPRNMTCDALMRSLINKIPKTKLFRANAAFRDMELVPDDIIPTCLFKGECFTCPPVDELREFNIVSSTYMSSIRLHNAGIEANHFSHIFLVDASSTTEPEAIVALANLVCEKTVIVITGSMNDFPRWVRSGIGRGWNGLKRSLFHRLMEIEPYSNMDSKHAASIRSG